MTKHPDHKHRRYPQHHHPHDDRPISKGWHPGVKLLICLLVCYGIAATAGYATIPEIPGWYANLIKPPFNPPNWLFGPVWTSLYTMMAVSAWLVWKQQDQPDEAHREALMIFILQLIFNFAWSFLFFAWHFLMVLFVDVMFLWLMILLTLLRFRKLSKFAAWLLVPYLLWVTYASVLNGWIMLHN